MPTWKMEDNDIYVHSEDIGNPHPGNRANSAIIQSILLYFAKIKVKRFITESRLKCVDNRLLCFFWRSFGF